MSNPHPSDLPKARGCCDDFTGGLARREFLGAGALAWLATRDLGQEPPPPVPKKKDLPPEWLRDAAAVRRRGPLRGDALKHVAFPLGGIGTGFVALSGEGDLVEWQIFNNVNKKARVPESGLFLRIGMGQAPPILRALRIGEGGFPDGEFVGEYPFAELRLRDEALQLEVTVEAFNPLVPLDAKASSYPAAVFRVNAHNTGKRQMELYAFATLLDAVGYDGQRPFDVAAVSSNDNSARVRAGLPREFACVSLEKSPFRPAQISKELRVLMLGSAPRTLPDDLPPGIALTFLANIGAADLDAFDVAFVNAGADPPANEELDALDAWMQRGRALFVSTAPGGWIDAATRGAKPGAVASRTRTLASFEGSDYGDWRTEGKAFGSGPATGPVSWQQPISGWTGRSFVNSFLGDDGPQGTLTSPEFEIDRAFVHLRVGGGAHAGATCVELLVDGKAVHSSTGKNSERLEPVAWDVDAWKGKRARLRAVDRATGPWGHVLLDDVRLSDLADDAPVADAEAARRILAWSSTGRGARVVDASQIDGREWIARAAEATGATYRAASGVRADDPRFGTMAIACRDSDGEHAVLADPSSAELGRFVLKEGSLPRGVAGAIGGLPLGAAGRRLRMGPAGDDNTTFLLTWHFPHRHLSGKNVGNEYSKRWKDASEVARDLAANLDPIEALARKYRDALYGSTIPWPLLDAAGSQASIIRSPTVMVLGDGSVAGFEGLGEAEGCCPMNCCHVYNYAQTTAHLFPDLERNVRRLDLERQQNADGGVNNRIAVPIPQTPSGERPFADGHLGTILKVYREHLRSADDSFLRAEWPRVKKALEYAIRELDRDEDGVLEAEQWNTYDQIVTGPNTFVGSLYLAALRAGEEMAQRVGEAETAARYRKLFDSGSARYAEICWNGEFFDQRGGHEVGKGCLADQLLGEWWARLLGLGPVLPEAKTKKALDSIWRFNFLPDFSQFRHSQRVFADGKDRGLLICSWPRGGRPGTAGWPGKPILYCDEVWTGVEYEVAALLLETGHVEPALAVVRAARDRYDGTKRNPWNEIECGDQYARAMSSWGLLLAAQGFFLDGPAGVIGFAPKFAADDHRSLFTGPEGWGTFAQRRIGARFEASIDLAAGKLTLRELRLAVTAAANAPIRATLGDTEVAASRRAAAIALDPPVEISPERPLRISIG